MRPGHVRGVFFGLVAGVCAGVGFAAPMDLKLLPLVPPGAQIVSGFENKPSKAGGPLLLTTLNNVLDLDDWRSLSGVDPRRSFNEVVEVTFAPAGTSLNEHLLLAAGRFQHDTIFHSAELNGAASIKYSGENVLVIEPFSREKMQMKDTRWLVILEDRIAAFGTPWMVQQAVNRFENRASPDPVLMKRLSLFRRDVDSWNVLMSMPGLRQSVFLQANGALSALFDGAELMMVAVHYESKVRVDLMMLVGTEQGSVDLKQKAAQFGRAFSQEVTRDNDHSPQLKDLRVEENHVRVSILLSKDDFSLWKTGQMSRDKALIDLAVERAKKETAQK